MRAAPLGTDPLIDPSQYRHMAATWPAGWIGPGETSFDKSGVWAYRLKVEHHGAVRIHVSADQRYILFLDGKPLGRGPERGDLRHWMYDTYDLSLTGAHTLVAVAWWFSPTGPAQPAEAQQTVRPAFLLMAEGDGADRFHTGKAPWEVKPVDGMSFEGSQASHQYYAVDPRVRVDGFAYPWGVETGAGDGWRASPVVHQAAIGALVWESHPYWLLRPAMLPPMRTFEHDGAVVRHVSAPTMEDLSYEPVRAAGNLSSETAAWQAMLSKQNAITIPPNTRRRVIVDLTNYICAFTRVVTDGGAGATVGVRWTEALAHFDPKRHNHVLAANLKDCRNDIDGRHFLGYGDTFTTDGGRHREFRSLWWGAGRFIEIDVRTGAEPLTIGRVEFTRTEYPYSFNADFKSSDERLANVIPLALHTLQMCSHETSMDCPFYEQLNYAGDTRLQSLVAMTCAEDDRLVRKGIKLFDWSRNGDGWTSSRYPTRVLQTIPTFGMCWVSMVFDYARYRGDRAFLATCMPGVRAVIERWREQIDENGLVVLPAGWNFVDWVSGWQSGVPRSKPGQHSCVVQWQLVYTLELAAQLEEMMNEPLLAQRHRQTASSLAARAEQVYFDEARGLLADDEGREHFSEHAQALAILSGHLSANLRQRVGRVLIDRDASLAATSIYFSHYTFEALRLLDRTDKIIDRMQLWFDHESMGLKTLLESPEPSRSDCHAWGAHPVYHYYATLLGIRPAGFGFDTVEITPRLGSLQWAEGTMTHPKGHIHARFSVSNGRLSGEVTLPAGVTGKLVWSQRVAALASGRTTIDCSDS